MRQPMRQRCRRNVEPMLTLTALRNDLTDATTTPRGRRLYRTWTAEHPILGAHDSVLDAITAAQSHDLDSDEILNALLQLSATQPPARQAIAVAFAPWINGHLATHRSRLGERDEHIAVLIAAFIEAAVTLAADAPYLWPASTIVHAAENPICRHYRHLVRAAEPIGPVSELEKTRNIRLLLRFACATSGPELVVAGLIQQLHAGTVTLQDANIVARIVADGHSARQQAPGLYLSARAAQHRVRNVAHQLTNNAA